MKRMKGTEIFVECLRREGVEVIFGHPGGGRFCRSTIGCTMRRFDIS
jgi:hypothetical protein